MTDVTLTLSSTDEVLILRYLNIAIAEGKKSLDLVLENPETFAKYPVWESNARFDVEQPERLKAIIEAQREARRLEEEKRFAWIRDLA